MTYSLGIDLGTTYTAAAIARGGRAEVVTLGYRMTSIPTVVVLTDDGTFLVGDPAERRAAERASQPATQPDPVTVVPSFKACCGMSVADDAPCWSCAAGAPGS